MQVTQRTDLSDISLLEWHHIERHAESAMKHWPGRYEWSDILKLLIAGKLQLWTAGKSIVMTEVIKYPRLTACRIFLAGGKLDEVKEIFSDVEKSAADIGCSMIEGSGRDGWAVVAEQLGYTKHSIFTKDIS